VSNARRGNVRFGSKADICSAKRHVRFAPNSDRESGHGGNALAGPGAKQKKQDPQLRDRAPRSSFAKIRWCAGLRPDLLPVNGAAKVARLNWLSALKYSNTNRRTERINVGDRVIITHRDRAVSMLEAVLRPRRGPNYFRKPALKHLLCASK
jgi:hypothetical protein